jgi:hypothetical protein
MPLVSPGTRFEAVESNDTKRPSPLMEGRTLLLLAWVPSEAAFASEVVPVCWSWTKMSKSGLVSGAPDS